ncbi:hypothetical protein KCU77_g32, partial [Aureobasidium melanogenum]
LKALSPNTKARNTTSLTNTLFLLPTGSWLISHLLNDFNGFLRLNRSRPETEERKRSCRLMLEKHPTGSWSSVTCASDPPTARAIVNAVNCMM